MWRSKTWRIWEERSEMVLCRGFKRIQHFLSPSVVVFKALSSTKRSLTVSIAAAIEGRGGVSSRTGLPRPAILNPLSQWLWGLKPVDCQVSGFTSARVHFKTEHVRFEGFLIFLLLLLLLFLQHMPSSSNDNQHGSQMH